MSTVSQSPMAMKPTLIMFKGGNAEATKVGALSKTQLTAFIQEVV